MTGAAARVLNQHGVARSDVAASASQRLGPLTMNPAYACTLRIVLDGATFLSRGTWEGSGAPCWIDHDFNCFALAEKFFGQGAGIKNYLCIYLGTGVSAAIVIGGEVYRGSESFAGEFGHTCITLGISCACGNKGCVEAYVTGPALAAAAIRQIGHGSGSALLSLAGNDASCITAEIIDNAARQGDPLSRPGFSLRWELSSASR